MWAFAYKANAITEIQALKILTGTEAFPIVAGGVEGAEVLSPL
jgi:hypothetical protein